MSEEFHVRPSLTVLAAAEPYPCLVRPLTDASNMVGRIGGRCAAPLCLDQLGSVDWLNRDQAPRGLSTGVSRRRSLRSARRSRLCAHSLVIPMQPATSE